MARVSAPANRRLPYAACDFRRPSEPATLAAPRHASTAREQPFAAGSFPPGAPSPSVLAPPATITSADDLTSVTATGAGSVRDIFGVTHQVTFDVTWTGFGGLETDVRTTANQGFSVNTSTRKQRAATATGVVTFDGVVLVDGEANHLTRPAPFIRTDEERTTRPPSN
jgi:hypothetical protein